MAGRGQGRFRRRVRLGIDFQDLTVNCAFDAEDVGVREFVHGDEVVAGEEGAVAVFTVFDEAWAYGVDAVSVFHFLGRAADETVDGSVDHCDTGAVAGGMLCGDAGGEGK